MLKHHIFKRTTSKRRRHQIQCRQLAGLFLAGFLSWQHVNLIAQILPMNNGNKIGIVILGSITNKNEADNVALIKVLDSNRIVAVKLGQQIKPDITVVGINRKYIIVERGAETFIVYQNKFAQEFTTQAMVKTNLSDRFAAEDDVYREPGFERSGGQIRLTESYRKDMLTNQLPSILMQATAIPFLDANGQIIGFQLLQIDAGSIYDKAGFKNGDIIKSLNGTPLSNVSRAIQLLNQLKSSPEITVELIREQRDLVLTIQVTP